MRILVTGASGFIGSQLISALQSDQHSIRALGRDPERVRSALAAASHRNQARDSLRHTLPLEVVSGDAVSGHGLPAALDGVEVAYYLIHSMERPPNGHSPFVERELRAAESFAAAATSAGVRRIVYLGGLVPSPEIQGDVTGAHRRASAHARASRHLASREHVERILLGAVADSLALRASIVIGARSRSFRLLVHLVERMPVLTLPAWHTFRTQPIDARDVIAMLRACATTSLSGRYMDIGGPNVLSYGDMLSTIAELMLVNRPALRLKVNLTAITARVAAAIASEEPELVLPLMEGLNGDLLPADDRAAELLGVRLHTFDAAVEHALSEWESTEPLAAR